VTVKILLVGRVVLQVISGPKVVGDVVEQVLGQHTELIKSSHCEYATVLCIGFIYSSFHPRPNRQMIIQDTLKTVHVYLYINSLSCLAIYTMGIYCPYVSSQCTG